MTTLLSANSISKKYNPFSNHMELKPTSLKINECSIYVIKGKSGSGKTTLLSILGGIDRPTSGSVYFNNRSFYDLSDKEQSKIRNENYGFIFQAFNLIPELTVKENIELPKYFGSRPSISNSDVVAISEELGIESLLSKKPFHLSGGEQQRVAIARALISRPNIIFADEPTGNLDHANSRIISDLLVKIVLSTKSALIIVTHEENLIEHQHYNLFIQDGELKMEGNNV